jgi:hypothetical protein
MGHPAASLIVIRIHLEPIVYLPSMFFGGSSLLHLLAGHPKIVAAFGLAAVLGLAVHAPFGAQPVLGTTRLITNMERRVGTVKSVDESVDAARRSALLLQRSSPATLSAAIARMLQDCGHGCTHLTTAMVMDDPALLQDVLLLHELDRLPQNVRDRSAQSGQTQ